MRSVCLPLMAVVFFAACNKDKDEETPDSSALEGIYEVTRYTNHAAGCDATGSEETPESPYFQVAVESVFGVTMMAVYPCESSSVDSCDDDLFGATYFETFDDEGASGETGSSTSFSGDTCYFNWMEATLQSDGDKVTLTIEDYDADPSEGEDLDDCVAQQESFSGERSCVRSEVHEGVRVE